MPTKTISRVTDEELANSNKEAATTYDFLSILPLVLSLKGSLQAEFRDEDEQPLPTSALHALRLACKGAKAAVDPYLIKINVTEYMHWREGLEDQLTKNSTRSPLLLAATRIFSDNESFFNREAFTKFTLLPFGHVQTADLYVDSDALDIVPAWEQSTLTELELRIHWHYKRQPSLNFNAFSKAKWPLLENLSLDIHICGSESDRTDVCDIGNEDDDRYIDVSIDFEEAFKLLSYFPKLKSLSFEDAMSSKDLEKLVAHPQIENLEKLSIGFIGGKESKFSKDAAVLAGANFEKLQGLEVSVTGDIDSREACALLKAPWILQLRVLTVWKCGLCLGGANELINCLQMGAL
jgi:hypothetical protein